MLVAVLVFVVSLYDPRASLPPAPAIADDDKSEAATTRSMAASISTAGN
jgi:hypothetical protein